MKRISVRSVNRPILAVSMPGRLSKDNPIGRRPPAGPVEAMPSGFVIVTVGKWLSNVAFRLVFPFLPRIASGLGVSLGAMGTALAVREFAGLASPSLGRAADRRGHGRAMVVGLAGLSLALVLQGTSSGLILFTVGLVALSLTKSLYDVASAAWVGDSVPFHARGRAIGFLESSWALAFVIGMPIAALLIRAGTWRVPFILTAAACVVMAAVAVRLFQDQRPAPSTAGPSPLTALRSPTMAAAAATFVLMGVGHSMILVTFSAWLEDTHGVSIGDLGLTAFVIGAAELTGSAGTALFSDRLGLRRSLVGGLTVAAVASAVMLVGDTSFGAALATMALYFVAVEFTIVVLLSLFTELTPNARATAMGIAFASFAVGHALGAVAGTQLYERVGMTENLLVMGAAFALAVLPATRLTPPDPQEVDPHDADQLAGAAGGDEGAG